MSAIIASRFSAPVAQLVARRASAAPFSTTTASMKPAVGDATTSAAAGSSWAWRNLSPKARRNVMLGLGAGAAIDAYVVYNYFPGMLGLGEKKN